MVKQLRFGIQRSWADVISFLNFLEILVRKSLAELVSRHNTDKKGERSVNEHWPATHKCQSILTAHSQFSAVSNCT